MDKELERLQDHWVSHRIYRDCLKTGQRKLYDLDAELQEFEYEPEILTGKDYWVPTIDEFEALTDIIDDRTRSYEEKVL